jgi:hypothetical protein
MKPQAANSSSSTRSIATVSRYLLVLALIPVSAHSTRTFAAVAEPASAASSAEAQSQSIAGFGPLDPDPPTGLTPQQVIDKFGARETAFSDARKSYTYRQAVKVDALDLDTNKVIGEYQQVTDIIFTKEGRRDEHVVFAPQNTLDNANVMMSPADFKDIEQRLPFVLTTADLPQYDVTYLGRQKVDELDTYVFDVTPKVIEKNKRYFKGKAWVDQQDFQIVLINGKNVPDDVRRGHEDLSPPFTTYYEQVDGKYWFPTYTKAEGMLHFAAQSGALSQDVHLRNTIRYTDYKQFHVSARIIYDGQDITNESTPEKGKQPPPAAPPK